MRKTRLLALMAVVAVAALGAPAASHAGVLGPDMPRITNPANAGGYGSLSMNVTGFAEPGNTVTVVDGTPPCPTAGCGSLTAGPVMGSTTVVGVPAAGDDDAAFSVPVTFAAEGQKRIYVYSIYPSGQASVPAVIDFLVDPDGPGDPAAPVILTPSAGDNFTSGLVTVSGTAEPGADVVVHAETTALRHATAAADGSWSLVFGFPNGAHSITAYQIDLAKNVGPTSAPVGFTVTLDTTVPSAPVITAPTQGAIVPAAFTISGTADPFSSVQVFEDTRAGFSIYGTVSADGSGLWSLSTTLLDGLHFLQARATGANGIQGPASPVRQIRVDASVPIVHVTLPSLYLLTQVSTLQGAITGTANDNVAVASVHVVYHDFITGALVQDDPTTCVGCGTSSVSWSDTTAVAPGLYTVSAYAIDEVGNVSFPSSVNYLQLPV